MPGGSFSQNKSGLFDVHGNVWEFVEDCWSADTSFLPLEGRPLGLLGNCDYRAMRGGGWDSPPSQVRSASRAYAGPSAASNTTGFRVMRPLDGD
jgi:formylglycine-generating enzyme required for sulfatase activity